MNDSTKPGFFTPNGEAFSARTDAHATSMGVAASGSGPVASKDASRVEYLILCPKCFSAIVPGYPCWTCRNTNISAGASAHSSATELVGTAASRVSVPLPARVAALLPLSYPRRWRVASESASLPAVLAGLSLVSASAAGRFLREVTRC